MGIEEVTLEIPSSLWLEVNNYQVRSELVIARRSIIVSVNHWVDLWDN